DADIDFVFEIGDAHGPGTGRIGDTGRPDFFLEAAYRRYRNRSGKKVFAVVPGAAEREAAEAQIQTDADFFGIGCRARNEHTVTVAGHVKAVDTDVDAAERARIVERDLDHVFDRGAVRIDTETIRVRAVVGRFRGIGETELEAGEARGEVGHLVRVGRHQREGRVAEADTARRRNNVQDVRAVHTVARHEPGRGVVHLEGRAIGAADFEPAEAAFEVGEQFAERRVVV